MIVESEADSYISTRDKFTEITTLNTHFFDDIQSDSQ